MKLSGKFPGDGPPQGDIRGLDRSYLVAPPSTIEGQAYRWLRHLVPPERLPVASRELLAWLAPSEPPRPSQRPTASITKPTAYALAALEREHDELASTTGGRHFASLRAAQSLGTLVGAGLLDYHDALDALLAASEINGYLTKRGRQSLERTLRDGLDWGKARPREVKS